MIRPQSVLPADQRRVAIDIEEAAAALARRATAAGLPTLAYLLECARIEASQVARPGIPMGSG